MSTTLYPEKPIFIVDDEPHILVSYDTALRLAGFNNIQSCGDSREVLNNLHEHGARVLLLDLMMPYCSGEDILPRVLAEFPHLPVIVITGKDDTRTAVTCMKEGAFEYLVKPVDRERLISTVRQAMTFSDLRGENLALRDHLLSGRLHNPANFSEMITNHPSMYAIFQYVEAIAPTRRPVLITGETGTGKEILARAIHRSGKNSGPFITANVTGLDAQSFSETLFGDFGGRPGLVEKAGDGVLFLDEIGDLDPDSQLKLLRLLQEDEYYSVGSDKPKRSKARIVVSTNRDLHRLQEQGSFRRDLFFRLRSHWIQVPPLRRRLDDLELLINHFLEETAEELGKKTPSVPKELYTLLATYHFPGNVRELRAMIHEAMSLHQSMMLSLDVFKKHLFESESGEEERVHQQVTGGAKVVFGPSLPKMEEMKHLLIEEAMRRTGGNKTLAANMLDISRQAISWREKKETKKSTKKSVDIVKEN